MPNPAVAEKRVSHSSIAPQPAALLERAPISWLPTDAWVRLLLVPVITFMALAGNTSYLADFWHHLARGRAIVSTGALLDHDVFTFTVAGQEFQDVNWLSQVAYFLLYREGGLALVRVVNALCMALALALVVNLCRRLSGSLVAAVAVGVVVFLAIWQVLTIRPQTFSLLLFVVVFDLLERAARRPWLLVLPPALLALWANLHGAFIAGLLLVGCWVVAAAVQGGRFNPVNRRARQLAICLGACVLATLANPYGWRIYEYVAQTSGRAASRGIDEWVPPSFDQPVGIAFFAALAVLAALLMLTWRRGLRPCAPGGEGASTWDVKWLFLALALCFLPLAAGSVRMVPWWILAMAPLAAVLLAGLLPPAKRNPDRPSVAAGLCCGGLLIMAALSVPCLQELNPLLAFRPKQNVEADLDTVLAGLAAPTGNDRIFTRFEWGEYVAWAADSRTKIFMDGRIEIYSDKVWKEYEAITRGEGWEQILAAYGVDALVLDADYHARTGLLAKVTGSPCWARTLQAGNALLYVRK